MWEFAAFLCSIIIIVNWICLKMKIIACEQELWLAACVSPASFWCWWRFLIVKTSCSKLRKSLSDLLLFSNAHLAKTSPLQNLCPPRKLLSITVNKWTKTRCLHVSSLRNYLDVTPATARSQTIHPSSVAWCYQQVNDAVNAIHQNQHQRDSS